MFSLFENNRSNDKGVFTYPQALTRFNTTHEDKEVAITFLSHEKGRKGVPGSVKVKINNELKSISEEVFINLYNTREKEEIGPGIIDTVTPLNTDSGPHVPNEAISQQKKRDVKKREPEQTPLPQKTTQSTQEKKRDSDKELNKYVVRGNPDLVIQKGREFETVDKELKKATLRVETIKRFSNREIYVDLTVVDESGATESMSVTPEELATILKKSRENQKNLPRNSRAKTPSLNTTPRKKDTTSDTLPLGLRKKQKIEVYDEVYTVAGYDTATKKFSLISDSGKRELVDYDNMEFALAPKESVGSLSPEEKLDAAKLQAKAFLEEARTWIDARDIDSLVGVITKINDAIVAQLALNASDAEVGILKEAKTSLEQERDTLLQQQKESTVDKKIHIAEASIDMLRKAIANDEALLTSLQAELEEKLTAEKNIAGKKIFDAIVASATTEVLATGTEGNNYYYDAKDGRGYTIRHYYRFDGTFDGNKTIAEPEKEPEPEREQAPGEYSRLISLVRFQVENPKEPTTIEIEKFLQRYPVLEKKIRGIITEQREKENEAVHKRGIYNSHGPVDTYDAFNADPSLEYPELRDELRAIYSTYANKLMNLPWQRAVEKKVADNFNDTYTPLTTILEKEAFILASGSRLNRLAFKTREEFIESYEKSRKEVLNALETGDMKKVLAAEGFVPNAIDRFENEGRIEEEFLAVLKTYGLEKK